LAEELRDKVKAGEEVLLPTSNIAHNSIAKTIKEIGANIDTQSIYDVVTPIYEKGRLLEVLSGIEVITFTSPSCVKGFISILMADGEDISLLKSKEIVCIGPITGKALREVGIENFRLAKVHNSEGVAREIRHIQ
jgi:uroporphyrinogen III methyltransferase/synthase